MKDDARNPVMEGDIHEIKALLDEEAKVGQGTRMECLKAVQFLQQWTGVNYFVDYGATIFQSAGIDDPILVQLILGAANVTMAIPDIHISEQVGHQWPLCFGALWQTAWIIIFTSISMAINPQDSRAIGIIMVVSACLFIASFAISWGPLG
ncbi:hypothetical protein EDB81DRAFT_891539 [Dactylonectria macrodidyma]|uniref:Uncharacterized protein n=1 Tax=Dactylonectria macrodidyma TaxID=307937 RepID=A0A9P9DHI5_9HYPO|nr:hypothetical protein EDB81DRAFT_891539 [Dactylonectria macrodidyma]